MSRRVRGLFKLLGGAQSADTGGEGVEFKPGDRVIWHRSLAPMPWVERVRAEVVRVTDCRVRIRFTVEGTETEADGRVLERSVRPCHLEKAVGDG
ncbi:hypothetical protein [Gloeobacter morelensis]|uniref:hypothetical protein n=1 Tax=Gloeobacter morelensis TaxID=2907343 RepID=UPI001E4E3AAB|nr:hypothetical protein [Gloeobacter morelensis]UFP97287.1 hypothetical protein ISF26_24510 [Gloeobacter morelensis MG652769]